MSEDVVDRRAKFVLNRGCGLTIGLVGLCFGMITWPDPEISIHGRRNCGSTEVSNGLWIAGHLLHLALRQVTALFPHLLAVLARDLCAGKCTSGGMTVLTLQGLAQTVEYFPLCGFEYYILPTGLF